ncbi:MAG: transcription elongation factor GreA [Candidatus Saccharimonadales bacterium]
MSKEYHLTEGGAAELATELAGLKARRGDVAEKLKSAKSEGDLSENADYTSALEEQEYVEGRINEIETVLHNATIINTPKGNKAVALGNRVELKYNGSTVSYQVVGSLESDPGAGKISEESPIGKALLGAKVGDETEINTPSGLRVCTVTKIS